MWNARKKTEGQIWNTWREWITRPLSRRDARALARSNPIPLARCFSTRKHQRCKITPRRRCQAGYGAGSGDKFASPPQSPNCGGWTLDGEQLEPERNDGPAESSSNCLCDWRRISSGDLRKPPGFQKFQKGTERRAGTESARRRFGTAWATLNDKSATPNVRRPAAQQT